MYVSITLLTEVQIKSQEFAGAEGNWRKMCLLKTWITLDAAKQQSSVGLLLTRVQLLERFSSSAVWSFITLLSKMSIKVAHNFVCIQILIWSLIFTLCLVFSLSCPCVRACLCVCLCVLLWVSANLRTLWPHCQWHCHFHSASPGSNVGDHVTPLVSVLTATLSSGLWGVIESCHVSRWMNWLLSQMHTEY